MARCRFCGEGSLEWVSESGRWKLYYPNRASIHRCLLAIAYYSGDNVVKATIEAFLQGNRYGTRDQLIIDELRRGRQPTSNGASPPNPIVGTPPEYRELAGSSVVVGNASPSIPAPSTIVAPSNTILDITLNDSDLLVWKGMWSRTEHYVANDAVIFASTLFRCRRPHTGIGPDSTTYWKRLSEHQQRTLFTTLQAMPAPAPPMPGISREPIRAIKV